MKPIRLKTYASAGVALAAGVLTGIAADAPEVAHPAGPTTNEYIATLFVFMLATFVGLDVIRRVSRLLHTPLMSLTNAISAIAVVGSLLVAGRQHGGEGWTWINLLGLVAITASVTNIVSGFLITDRMLKMFKKREAKKP
jgi:H+-translocating NAD(P) transhydrogenase subunit alpha